MKELEVLLNKRWILKSRDKETYYKIRDALGELRKFTTEKMGCQIIDNSLLIKMEKIPVIPESFMGIQKFSSKEEYAYLCILLMFLEDRDAQEQFILSQLTEYITANLPGEISDWTLYTNRRKLIRVLRFAVDQGIVDVTDGKDEAFMDDEAGEVLYENTGASRYFMKNFSKDIMEYTKPEDFQESDWFEVDEDRGFARRHRVYKRLIFAPGMYKEDGSPEDFEYLKYYGRRLSEELEQIFDCQVHIHRRILIGWMGIPDADYDNDATVAYDWIHALTMPRELEWKDGKILQHPLKEMKDLRKNAFTCELEAFTKWAPADCCFELRFDVEEAKNLELKLREDVTISWKDGLFTLSMGESGRGRKQRFAKVEELSDITIFSDTSAIEIFINNGETVLTTRVYSEHLEQKVELVSREVKGSVHGYELGSFEVEYKK